MRRVNIRGDVVRVVIQNEITNATRSGNLAVGEVVICAVDKIIPTNLRIRERGGDTTIGVLKRVPENLPLQRQRDRC